MTSSIMNAAVAAMSLQLTVARAVLDDPNWGHHAAVALGQPEGLPVQYERAGAAHWPGYAAARASAD